MKKNKSGRNSLIIAVLGLIVIQSLISIDYLENHYWHILLAGFEAATVGGFADWFAVKALFHEIPIPFINKHTNIIVKNRTKISNSIVDLVTNQWLSPEIIKNKISSFSISSYLINFIKNTDQKNFKKFTDKILEITKSKLDINNLIRLQIDKADLGLYLGNFIKKNIDNSNYNALWIYFLNICKNNLSSKKTTTIITNAIQTQLNDYQNESFFKKIVIGIGKGSKTIDVNSISSKLIEALEDLLNNSIQGKDLRLKNKVDNYLISFSEDLINNKNTATTEKLKISLKNIDWEVLIDKLYQNKKLKTSLSNELSKLLTKFESNKAIKKNIDDYFIKSIGQLITNSKTTIGNTVLESLNILQDKELVEQLESKVGNDLEYIRLNGAIVGGFIGIIICTIRTLFTL